MTTLTTRASRRLDRPEPTRDDRIHPAGETAGLRALSWAVLLGSLAFFLWGVTRGWDGSLMNRHGFRQTQTALTSLMMLRDGGLGPLAYETPVLGPPWTIPQEFPLYQWLAAGTVRLTGMELDPAGRLVGVAFFLLTLLAAGRLLAVLGFSGACRRLMLSLALLSPYYIFWSRAFLIESTALCFSLAFLAAFLAALWSPRPRPALALLAAAAGAAAALVKIPSFAPMFLAAGALAAWEWASARGGRASRPVVVRAVALPAMALGLPVLAYLAWDGFVSPIRSDQPFGAIFVPDNYRSWFLGTLAQRLDPETWRILLPRTVEPLGNRAVLVVAAIGLVAARRRRRAFAAAVALFLAPYLMFTNVHVVHDYYAYSNNLFLIAAVGVALAAMIERGGPLREAALLGLVPIALASACFYRSTYLAEQLAPDPTVPRVGEVVRRHSGPGDVVVSMGFDWSSEVPYYSRRRGLAVPGWATEEQLSRAIEALGAYRVGALVVRTTMPEYFGPFDLPRMEAALRAIGFEGRPHQIDGLPSILIYLPPGAVAGDDGLVPLAVAAGADPTASG